MQMIEGKNAILESLRAGARLSEILVADGAKEDANLTQIIKRAKDGRIKLTTVPRKELDRLSEHGAHQGVMAKLAPYAFSSLPQIFKRTQENTASLLIALDHVTDPGNLGAIVRSAEVVGADGIIVPSRRSAAITPATYKASAGALAHMMIAQETNLARALDACKQEGYWIVGATEKADQTCWEAPLEGRIVLVMGSEGEGLAPLVERTCDLTVRLPQRGKVASLNVAQATTVLAYEWMRKSFGASRDGALEPSR